MVGLKDLDAEFLDVSKPYLATPPPKNNSFWRCLWAGGRSKKTSQTPRQVALAESRLLIEAPGVGHGIEHTYPEQDFLQHPAVESVEAEVNSTKEEVASILSAAQAVAQPEMLRQLDGLKQAVSGLQNELNTLRKDNGTLRSALCAHTGGTLPVEAFSASPIAASLTSTSADRRPWEAKSTATGTEAGPGGEDELAAAQPAGEDCASHAGHCWQASWFEKCSCGSVEVGLENATASKSSPPCSPEQLETSAGGGSWNSSMSSSIFSPPRPARETPMRASRDLHSAHALFVNTRTGEVPRTSQPQRSVERWTAQVQILRVILGAEHFHIPPH
ncbi:unnamed protein product [Symbiodinium pilosum]|uniref:Uncharacterized protein n=1 Tax=Symbiodinium pilosum TaxID=2952 RepID=A0A812XD04_SYMPI|nr:unnamed protein product [Symbiodinium pilosum]